MMDPDEILDRVCNTAGGMLTAIGRTVADTDPEDRVRDVALVQQGVLMLVGALGKYIDGDLDATISLGDAVEGGVALMTARAETLGIRISCTHVPERLS